TAGVDRRHVRGPAARARPGRGGVRGGVLARVARGTAAPADASSLRVDVSRPGLAPPVRAYAAPCRLSSSTVAVAACGDSGIMTTMDRRDFVRRSAMAGALAIGGRPLLGEAGPGPASVPATPTLPPFELEEITIAE